MKIPRIAMVMGVQVVQPLLQSLGTSLLLFMALSGLPSGAEGQCHLFMYIFFA
jgi:type III secretory pathway component EscR